MVSINAHESRSVAMNRACGCLAAGMIVTMVWTLIASAIHFWEWAERDRAYSNLNWVGRALHQYHETYDCFPPAVVYDDHGNPMHSWRASIVPQLNETISGPTHNSAYRFDEPWTSQNNRSAADAFPGVSGNFSFLAVVGPEAAWPTTGCRQMRDISDGLSKTILVVAIEDLGVGWHEPCDLEFDGKDLWLDHGGRRRRINLSEIHSFVLFANASIKESLQGMSESDTRKLLTSKAGDRAPDVW